MRNSKLFLRISILFFLFFTSCVSSPDLKLAEYAMKNGDLKTAHQHYVKVLQQNPSNKAAMDALVQIRPQLTQKARQEAEANLQSSGVITAPLLKSSLAILQAASEFDPDGSLLNRDVQQYQADISQIASENLDRAQQVRRLLEAQQFIDAQKTLNMINQTDPDFAGLPQLRSKFITGYGAFLEKTVLNAYRVGKTKEARAAMNQWLSLNFPPAEQDRLKASVKTYEIDILKKQSQRLAQKKQYYKAFIELNQSPYKTDVSDTLLKIRRDGARFYLDQARKQFRLGNVSRALRRLKAKNWILSSRVCLKCIGIEETRSLHGCKNILRSRPLTRPKTALMSAPSFQMH